MQVPVTKIEPTATTIVDNDKTSSEEEEDWQEGEQNKEALMNLPAIVEDADSD